MYQYICNICAEFYVGKTNLTMKRRHMAHAAAIKRNDTKASALSEHLVENHNDPELDMSTFTPKILERNRQCVDNNIAEMRKILELEPAINRKWEGNYYLQV